MIFLKVGRSFFPFFLDSLIEEDEESYEDERWDNLAVLPKNEMNWNENEMNDLTKNKEI